MTKPVKNQQPLTTVSGKFHAGMTAAEAKKKDLYNSVFSTDFRDIDRNKNDVLEDWEICDQRDSESRESLVKGAGVAVLGAISVAAATLAAPFTAGASSVAIVGGSVGMTTGGYYIGRGIEERQETNKYRKQHGLE